jgi:hypothetical protein
VLNGYCETPLEPTCLTFLRKPYKQPKKETEARTNGKNVTELNIE